jgi:hypothetical protein
VDFYFSSGVGVPAGVGIFLFSVTHRLALRSNQTPIRWVPGASSVGVKRSSHDADHSPPSIDKVDMWSFISALGFESRPGLVIFLFNTMPRPALGSKEPLIQ